MTSSRPSDADPSADDPASSIPRRRFLSLIARLTAIGLAGEMLSPRALAAAAAPGGLPLTGGLPPASSGWLDLGPSASLTDGSPAAFPFLHPAQLGDGRSARPGVVYVTALDGARLQAFSNICPHDGCRVHWDAAEHVFVCPWQNTSFAADGRVLTGPSQTPLTQFSARVRDGRIQIKINA